MHPSSSADVRPSRARSDRGSAGFALVEVMVSTVVLVIGVLGLFTSLLASRHLESSSQSYSSRVRTMSEAVEDLRNGPLVSRAQEMLAKPALTHDGLTVTVSFPAATLKRALPRYAAGSSPFQTAEEGGRIEVVTANAANPGILPVRMSFSGGGETTDLETLMANR
jgi:Tfp pilus assembly protein PilV